MLARDQHSSLLQRSVNYSRNKFYGTGPLLPANVKLDWKVVVKYKHSSLFGLVVSNEGKKFYNIDTR